MIEKAENGWLAGQIEEIPAVRAKGRTTEELKANITEAPNSYLEMKNAGNTKKFGG